MPKVLSQRQMKVGEHMRHILAQAVIRGDFPHLTITQVEPSPDLRYARVYILAPHKEKEALSALTAAVRDLQAAINKGSHLKFTPRLSFFIDSTFGAAQRIEDILQEIHT